MEEVKYKEVTDKWEKVAILEGNKVMCCDCGLVHSFDFKIVGGELFMRITRDRRATGQARRQMKKRAGKEMRDELLTSVDEWD